MFGRRQRAAPDTFGTEVLGYLEPLFATAMRLTRNRADAEDLVQDTVVRALRFRDRFEAGTNLRAWLYTILHNTWRNRIRDTAREATDVDSERIEELASREGPADVETPERMLLRSTMDVDLKEALDELPELGIIERPPTVAKPSRECAAVIEAKVASVIVLLGQ